MAQTYGNTATEMPKDPPLLLQTQQQADQLCEQLTRLRDRLSGVATATLGSQPPTDRPPLGPQPPTAVPNGAISALDEKLRVAQGLVDLCHAVASRLERIA